jgi:hypothetical protein
MKLVFEKKKYRGRKELDLVSFDAEKIPESEYILDDISYQDSKNTSKKQKVDISYKVAGMLIALISLTLISYYFGSDLITGNVIDDARDVIDSGENVIDGFSPAVDVTLAVTIKDSKDNIMSRFDVDAVDDGDSYSLELTDPGKRISKIKFNRISVDSSDLVLKIDDDIPVSDHRLDEDMSTVRAIFAIDPSEIGFSDAVMTMTASGTELFKCKDWNFSAQSCFGDWVKVMDIVPGQEYNITITATDPGFAETSPSTGTADSGNLVNVSNVNYVDGNFSSTWSNDDVFWAAGVYNGPAQSASPQGYLNLSFNISSLGLSDLSQVTELNFSLRYCHSSDIGKPAACSALSNGFSYLTNKIELFNYSSSSYRTIGSLPLQDGVEGFSDFTVFSGFSDFIVGNVLNVRYGINYSTGNDVDAVLAVDYSSLLVRFDNVAPVVQFVPSTDISGNKVPRGFILANVTASDSALKNITIYLYNSTAVIGQSSSASSPFFVNFSGLADGTYYLNASAVDTVGNMNWTAVRTVIVLTGVYYDSTPPTSTSPVDQTVDLETLTSISWVLRDETAPGKYYITKNGALYSGPTDWINDSAITISFTEYFTGNNIYTIQFNDSAGNNGVEDSVSVTILDNSSVACGEPPLELKMITVDGEFEDWESVLSNPNNYVFDLTANLGDPDAPKVANHDLTYFAFTWDEDMLYLYFKRQYTGTNIFSVIAYLDLDLDGYMNASDKVVKFVWSGANRQYDSDLFNYVPVSSADIMLGDGFDMPGSITLNKTLETNVLGGSDSGIFLEGRVDWADLGFDGPVFITFKAASALSTGLNLPSQIEDNTDVINSEYSDFIFTPDLSKTGTNGSFVFYRHFLKNCGLKKESFEFSSLSDQGFDVSLYYPNGTLVGDADSDGLPDISLDRLVLSSLMARIYIPSYLEGSVTDTTTIDAHPSFQPDSFKRVIDTTIIGDLVIAPLSRHISVSPDMTALLNFTVSNLRGLNDTIEIGTSSNLGWNISILLNNLSAAVDSDGDGSVDLGSFAPLSSKTFFLKVYVPATADIGSSDTIDIVINSSVQAWLSASGSAELDVKKRLSAIKDQNLSTAAGQNVYYTVNVSNNFNSSEVIDLLYSSVNNFSIVLLDSDMVTLLDDSDGDGLIDVGVLSAYGGTREILVEVTPDASALEDDSDLTTVYFNSSLTGGVFDVLRFNTTVKRVNTFSTVARTFQQTEFDIGSTVYARIFNLISARNVFFIWIDSNGTVVRTSSVIPVSSALLADDSLSTNESMYDGSWSVVVFNAQKDTEVGRTKFTMRDRIPPRVFEAVPFRDSSYNYTSVVEIGANVTDTHGIWSVFANITLPNGSVVTAGLDPAVGFRFNYSFLSGDGQIGNFSVLFIANDTRGNFNRSVSTNFFLNSGRFLDVANRSSKIIDYSLVLRGNSSGLLDVDVYPVGYPIKKISVTGLNVSRPLNILRIDRPTSDEPQSSLDFVSSYGIDPSKIFFRSANITVTSVGGHLFKCAESYNFNLGLCPYSGNYSQIRTFIPYGTNYTIKINSTDPGFGETLVGQDNTSDTYIYSQKPDENYGGSAVLRVGNLGVNKNRVLISFNLSELPFNAVVQSAELKLFLFRIPPGHVTYPRGIGIYRVSQYPERDWTEFNATWNSYDGASVWSSAGGDFNSTPTDIRNVSSANIGSYVSWNVTSDVVSFYSNLSLNFGWLLKEESEDNVRSVREFRSKEATNASQRPMLVINYTIVDYAPNVTLVSPANGSNFSSGNISFMANISDDFGLVNATLYTNLSGVFEANLTVNLSGKLDFSYFNITDIYKGGTFVWNVLACDNYGQCNFSRYNFTFSIIANMSPTVDLLEPSNGNYTVFFRTPLFRWTAFDPNGDPLTFSINITNDICPSVFQANISAFNFTPDFELGTQDECGSYNWSVTVTDGMYFVRSVSFNFSIRPTLILSFINASVDFGVMEQGGINDTTTDNPPPLILENRGNIFSRISNITMNQSLFESVIPPTDNFQAKVNFTDEIGAFNFSSSATSFFNISGTDSPIIDDFNFRSHNNSARIDLRVKVPMEEEGGEKIVGLVVYGFQR